MSNKNKPQAEKNKQTLTELGKQPELVGGPNLLPIYAVKDADNVTGEEIVAQAFKLADTSPEAWNALPDADRDMFINEVISALGAVAPEEVVNEDPEGDKKQPGNAPAQEDEETKAPGQSVAVIESTEEAAAGGTIVYTLRDSAKDFLDEAQRFLARVEAENTPESQSLHEAARFTGSAVFELKRVFNLN